MNKRDRKLGAALVAAQIAAASTAFANNIQVSSVTLQSIDTTADTAMVQFNLSWENSWRVATGPANHDAAWVFVKYHTGDLVWKTATLEVLDAAHVVPAAATLDVGVNGTRGLGAFIYRAATGSGNNAFNSIRLKWNYGADGVTDSALVTLDVHAIEMVYIPSGSFTLGDGVARAGTVDTATLIAGDVPANSAPYTVAASGALNVGPVAGALAHTGMAAGAYKAVPVTFPSGYDAFYTMKYEASQAQWAAFLNTTSKLGAITYQHYELLNLITPAVNPPRDFQSGRQVFFSDDLPAPTPIPGPFPANPLPATPTRTLVKAKFPDRAFMASVAASLPLTTTANSLNVTLPAVVPAITTASLSVGMPLTGNPRIPRGAVIASITNATTFVLGNVTAASVTAGTAIATTIAGPVDETVLAYLDWAGLRPQTEFEFEKSARGPVAPVAGEFAWGTADVALLSYGAPAAGATALTNDGLPGEAPAVNYNEAGGNAWVRATVLTLPAGGPILGPCRVGMFAKSAYNPPTPPRIQSGAGYYGVMDLTGNVSELVAKWSFPLAASALATFSAEHGDGVLLATGLHNVPGWSGATFYGLRGGSFADAATPVSARSILDNGTLTNPGIRGVRTAPVAVAP